MLALITGASSGIGKDMAITLSKKGYDLILVARSTDKLKKLQSRLKTNVDIIPMDLSNPQNCFELHSMTRDRKIDILINNAGYGLFGKFTDTNLNTELNMIDLNIKAVHILTKLYLKDFVQKNSGYIMNVSSLAAFCIGPMMSSYYSGKSYVLKLTEAINEELRHMRSNVHICALCPGPVETQFNNRAGVNFSIKPLSSSYVAEYSISQMFKKRMIIIPGLSNKLTAFITRLAPTRLILIICRHIQMSKSNP